MFAGNYTVAAAMVVLIVIRISPLALYFPWLQKHGLNIGIFLLMIAVMVPIASGKIPELELLKSFTHWKSGAAIVVGIFVAWLGGRGVLPRRAGRAVDRRRAAVAADRPVMRLQGISPKVCCRRTPILRP
ncbi:MAG: DUF441 family protein, partial [Janthinobacterium sp.]